MASLEDPPDTSHPPIPTSPVPPTPTTDASAKKPKTGGRPRANLDAHKAQILALYAAKVPWNQIEAKLLADHGIRAQGRTIMRRMKEEWGVEFRRVETDRSQTDAVKARIAAIWADKDNRPNTDAELHALLRAEGFTISVGAIHGLRKDMRLFRRWDEKLGRVRPDDELRGKRKRRRKQKYSAYTGATLAPPGGAEGDEDDGDGESDDDDDESSGPELRTAEPTREGWYPGLTLPKPKARKNRRLQKSLSVQPSQPDHRPPQPQPQPQPVQTLQPTPPHAAPSPPIAPHQPPPATAVFSDNDKDIQIRALLDRVHLLEQHCLAHGIGLAGRGQAHSPANDDVHSLQSLAAAVDMEHWQNAPAFNYHTGASAASLR